jgi:hypothetical protein
MKLVVKIGGAALDDHELLCRAGHKLVIVHGGGAGLSRTLKQLGCETTFIDGLRVTDSKTRDVALMVLAGLLNKQLVAAIGDAGRRPSVSAAATCTFSAPQERHSPTSATLARSARSISRGSSVCGVREQSRSSPASRSASTASITA